MAQTRLGPPPRGGQWKLNLVYNHVTFESLCTKEDINSTFNKIKDIVYFLERLFSLQNLSFGWSKLQLNTGMFNQKWIEDDTKFTHFNNQEVCESEN